MLDLHLRSGAARDERPLLYQTPDDAEGIVETTLRLLQDQLVAATQEDGRCAALPLDACHLHHLPAAHLLGMQEQGLSSSQQRETWSGSLPCPATSLPHSHSS